VSTPGRLGFAHVARLGLLDVDPAEVGAAVTTALCGHWGHDGPCRWPHNNQIRATDGSDGAAEFRTLFVAPPDEEAEVRSLVNAALTGDRRWWVLASGARSLSAEERVLADRLATTPEP
jgi:hypothetical protein